MKRYVILVSIILAFVFGGCAGAVSSKNVSIAKTPIPLKNKVKIYKHDKYLKFLNTKKVDKKDIKSVKDRLSETFYAISNYGKVRGYKYFAIVQDNMNNLSGFPINSFENIKDLCIFELKNAKKNYKPRQLCWSGTSGANRGIIINRYVAVKVRFFKEAIPGTFLYDIEEVINQTKQYL